MNIHYEKKQISYFSKVRQDLIDVLQNYASNRVLEIGAGGGDTILEIKKKNLAQEVVGIELNEIENSNQNNQLIDRFIFGNIEEIKIDLPKNYFDVILCGDVLEHLMDPWRLTKSTLSFIKPGGVLIVSCPNIRHYSALLSIYFKGRFDYKDEGLFDKTHLRFFCKANLNEMLAASGFTLEKSIPSFALSKPNKSFYINRLTLGLFEELLALQYVVVARKN